MTAPGQEPDEVTTGKPGRQDALVDPPNLDDIGDNHMPEDVRDRVKDEVREEPDEPDSTP